MTPYREYRPHPALAPYVACYWSITSPTTLINRVLPDSCTDILVGDTLEVVGAMRRAILVPVDSDSVSVGIRFKPGGGSAFFRLPLHEITDETLDLRALWGCSTDELTDRLTEVTTARDKLALVEAFLLRRFDGLPALDSTLQLAIDSVRRAHGDISVTTLRTDLSLSERQLERVFLQHIGISPRQFARTTRFRQVVPLLNQPALSLTDVAYRAGYYDQAHFIHDFKSLAGITPRDYRREQQNVGFLQFPSLTF